MRFKKSTVVGVVMTLYLSTGSWCMYISEKRIQAPNRKNETTSRSSDQIQICGNALTNLIIEACDGIVGSFSQANGSKGSAQAKITEDCCDHECPLDYLQTYCGQTPIFPTKKILRGKFLKKLKKSNGNGPITVRNVESKPPAEVRIKEKRDPKKKGKKGRRKRKRSFKWKCAFKTFAHFLLKLDRSVSADTNTAKRPNNINRSWPPIQVGTISPEMDKFGGQPTVVVKKKNNKSNPV